MTRLRHVVIGVLFWLAYDFSDPMIPGAFVFDPDRCIEATDKRSPPPDELVCGAVEEPRPVRLDDAARMLARLALRAEQRTARPRAGPLIRQRRDLPALDVPPAIEDH